MSIFHPRADAFFTLSVMTIAYEANTLLTKSCILIAENIISASQLILPIFVREAENLERNTPANINLKGS